MVAGVAVAKGVAVVVVAVAVVGGGGHVLACGMRRPQRRRPSVPCRAYTPTIAHPHAPRPPCAQVARRVGTLCPASAPLLLWGLAKLHSCMTRPSPAWLGAFWAAVPGLLPRMDARGLGCLLQATLWLRYVPAVRVLNVGGARARACVHVRACLCVRVHVSTCAARCRACRGCAVCTWLALQRRSTAPQPRAHMPPPNHTRPPFPPPCPPPFLTFALPPPPPPAAAVHGSGAA